MNKKTSIWLLGSTVLAASTLWGVGAQSALAAEALTDSDFVIPAGYATVYINQDKDELGACRSGYKFGEHKISAGTDKVCSVELGKQKCPPGGSAQGQLSNGLDMCLLKGALVAKDCKSYAAKSAGDTVAAAKDTKTDDTCYSFHQQKIIKRKVFGCPAGTKLTYITGASSAVGVKDYDTESRVCLAKPTYK